MAYVDRRYGGKLRAAGFPTFLLIAMAAGAAAAAPVPPAGTLSTLTPTRTWTGGGLVGANVDETTCIENTTCEVFTLTLAPGNYTGKRIQVGINWALPADDYDLYVHAGTLAGPVVANSGASTTTVETANITIDPPVVVAPIVYAVHVVAFAVSPLDNYSGQAALVSTPPPRVATYLPGNLPFSSNITVRAPVASSDGEPSVRVDVRGNCYVGGIRGVPAGVDLWRFDLDPASSGFDPGLQHPTYLGQPDAFLPQDPEDPTTGGADGGGDIDISCSFPSNPSATPVVTISSLAAAEISSAVSTNRGTSFTLSPAVAVLPSDDRQWNESTGESRVYMLYRAPVPATGLFVARSDDNGLTYPITGVVSPTGTTPGYIDVDHANGRVYASHSSSSQLVVGHSIDAGLTWQNTTVDNTTQHGTLFDPVKVGRDGVVYAVWSDGFNIYMAHSTDGGGTFSDKVRVSDNTTYKTNVFPWLECGSAGRVNVVWFASQSPVNNDAADWVVVFSQTLNATATSPTFRQQVISDHVIHGSNISTGGLTGSLNRNLLDYFQIALDPQGAAVVAFADDSNDYDGHTYLTRQLSGTSAYADANGNGLVNPVFPPAPPVPDPGEPEVADFLHDAVLGLLQPVPADSPFDILWIDYDCELTGNAPTLTATMKLSGLTTVPPAGLWRINFTANAPGGLSDRGDQFYLLADSQNPNAPVYTWGTAVRASDGSITYTSRGNADFGAFDTVNSQLTMKIRYSELNVFVTHGPPLAPHSVFWGLRGRASTNGANGILDITRGGRSFQCRQVSDVPEETAGRPARTLLASPQPNPARGPSTVEFALARNGFVDLAVFDARGRRVRTLLAADMKAGTYNHVWDGRTDRFSNAAAGVYFFTLHTAEGVKSRKITLMR